MLFFIFRIDQDERKQITIQPDEHSKFYYRFPVLFLKYFKMIIKKQQQRQLFFFNDPNVSVLWPTDNILNAGN